MDDACCAGCALAGCRHVHQSAPRMGRKHWRPDSSDSRRRTAMGAHGHGVGSDTGGASAGERLGVHRPCARVGERGARDDCVDLRRRDLLDISKQFRHHRTDGHHLSQSSRRLGSWRRWHHTEDRRRRNELDQAGRWYSVPSVEPYVRQPITRLGCWVTRNHPAPR